MCELCERKTKSYADKDGLEVYDAWLEKGLRIHGMDKYDIRKALGDDDTEESGGEEFLSAELIIAASLGLAFHDVGKVGAEKMLEIMAAEGARSFDKAVAAAEPYFEKTFAYAETAERVRANLKSAMEVGADMAGSRALLKDVFRAEQVLKEMVDATKYFTNTHFNKHVVPSLQKIVKDILDTGHLGAQVDTKAYNAVREAMELRLKSTPYWRIVANAAASRGFHYGAIKAGIIVGHRGYKIVTIKDKRRSKICKHMDGKKFWLADAEVQANKCAAATNEEIKDVAPWLEYSVIEKMTKDELKAAGFIIPPFHGHCRSSIEFI